MRGAYAPVASSLVCLATHIPFLQGHRRATKEKRARVTNIFLSMFLTTRLVAASWAVADLGESRRAPLCAAIFVMAASVAASEPPGTHRVKPAADRRLRATAPASSSERALAGVYGGAPSEFNERHADPRRAAAAEFVTARGKSLSRLGRSSGPAERGLPMADPSAGHRLRAESARAPPR